MVSCACEDPLQAVLRAPSVAVDELDDWSCSGAAACKAVDKDRAFRLAARIPARANPVRRERIMTNLYDECPTADNPHKVRR